MRPKFFLAFLLLLASFAAPAAAQPPPGAQPLDRLLPQIRRAYPGQFLDAEGVTAGGSPHYHLKWLTPDGRVMYLDADARTGRIQRLAPGRDTFDAPRAGGDAPRYRGEEQAGPPPDRGGEGRFNRSYDAPRFDGRAPYGGGQAAPPQSRFGNGGYGNRGFENRGGGGGRGYGGGSRGGDRGGNRR